MTDINQNTDRSADSFCDGLEDGLILTYNQMEQRLRREFARVKAPYSVTRDGKMPVFEIGGDNLPIKVRCDAPKDFYFIEWGLAKVRATCLDSELAADYIRKIMRGGFLRFEINRGLEVLLSGFCRADDEEEILEKLHTYKPELCAGAKIVYYRFGEGLVRSRDVAGCNE